MAGFWGRILDVDLTAGTMKDIPLDEQTCRDFVGGTGIGAKLLLERLDPALDPLDPANPLIIMTGPLTGTRIVGAVTRFSIVARSPYTGVWGEASCGGTLGVMLKRNGYDGVIFSGASPSPVWLKMLDGQCALLDASALWGKDTYETNSEIKSSIKQEHGKTATVFAIGPAGENMVSYANIMNDGHNAAGRCGFGALMGSKKLKAVAAWGNQKVVFADPDKLTEFRDAHKVKLENSLAVLSMTDFGTNGGMDLGSMSGDVPIKNWSLGTWDEGIDKINGPTMCETVLTRNAACFGCTVACKRVVKVDEAPYVTPEGPGPEYETVGAFGSNMLIPDLKPISKINEICNRAGMDTISCGGTIAWLIEAMERGLVTPDQTDGIVFKWGDPDTVIAVLDKIAKREGIGELLSLGSRALSRKLGVGADMLVEVKGLELPMHDPRAFWGMGLNYATGNRGACHVNTAGMLHEHGFCFFEKLGLGEESPPHQAEGKAEMTAKMQDLGAMLNCFCLCNFPAIPFDEDDYVNSINYATGFGYTLETLMEAGSRIWHIKRGINNLLGVTRADDRLPERILTPLNEGATEGLVIDIDTMLGEWYALRDIDEQGRPSRQALEKLGLNQLADMLHK